LLLLPEVNKEQVQDALREVLATLRHAPVRHQRCRDACGAECQHGETNLRMYRAKPRDPATAHQREQQERCQQAAEQPVLRDERLGEVAELLKRAVTSIEDLLVALQPLRTVVSVWAKTQDHAEVPLHGV